MDTLEYHFEDRCATIVMSRALLDELGAKVEDLEGIVSIPRRIEGVDVAVAFRENPVPAPIRSRCVPARR